MAPTGSAAALVDGSTYHSVLGINGSYASESLATMENIRARIEQVEYVFLDEISMVDCGSLYTISAQMCMALQIDHKAFGGKKHDFCWRLCTVTSPWCEPSSVQPHCISSFTQYPYPYSAEMGHWARHSATKSLWLWFEAEYEQKNQSAGDESLGLHWKICAQVLHWWRHKIVAVKDCWPRTQSTKTGWLSVQTWSL